MSFVDALKSEIEELERQLEADPTYIKLREAKRLLATYTNSNVSSITARPIGSTSGNTNSRATRPHTRPAASGVSAEIIKTARQAIEGRERPTPTKEILAILADAGVVVGGKNQQNVVSSLLSKSPEFTSHGRSGWTLAVPEGHETEKADDAAPSLETSSTLFENRLSQPVEPPAQGREAVPGGGT